MKPTLRLINSNDLENLRIWKNTNKQAFFYQHNITKEAQEKWYKNYTTRNFYNEDFMYIVEYNGNDVGCIGYRIIKDKIDIYNVMLGDIKFKGKGIIGKAMKKLCDQLKTTYPIDITVRVLIANGKAVEWYQQNGWSNIHVFNDYVLLQYGGLNETN